MWLARGVVRSRLSGTLRAQQAVQSRRGGRLPAESDSLLQLQALLHRPLHRPSRATQSCRSSRPRAAHLQLACAAAHTMSTATSLASKSKSAPQPPECAICKESTRSSQEVCRTLPCVQTIDGVRKPANHRFHLACIESLFRTLAEQEKPIVCPICRVEHTSPIRANIQPDLMTQLVRSAFADSESSDSEFQSAPMPEMSLEKVFRMVHLNMKHQRCVERRRRRPQPLSTARVCVQRERAPSVKEEDELAEGERSGL